MNNENDDDVDEREKLKLAMLYHVRKIVDDLMKESSAKVVSNDVVHVVNELVFRMCERCGSDLECFAQHAKRKVIMPNDVLLLTRRNQLLKNDLEAHMATMDGPPKKRARKSKAPRVASKANENNSESQPNANGDHSEGDSIVL